MVKENDYGHMTSPRIVCLATLEIFIELTACMSLCLVADNLRLEVNDVRGTYKTGPSSVITKGPWGNMLIQFSAAVGTVL